MAKAPPKPVEPVSYEFSREFNRIYRRTRLNVIYYGRRLRFVRGVQVAVGTVTRLGTSASVAALAIWRTDLGHTAMLVVGGVGVALQAVEPVVGLGAAVTRLTKVRSTYAAAFETLHRVETELQTHDGCVPSAEAQLYDVMARIAALAPAEDAAPWRWSVRSAQTAMEREMPPDRLWWGYATDDVTDEADASAGAESQVSGDPLQPA